MSFKQKIFAVLCKRNCHSWTCNNIPLSWKINITSPLLYIILICCAKLKFVSMCPVRKINFFACYTKKISFQINHSPVQFYCTLMFIAPWLVTRRFLYFYFVFHCYFFFFRAWFLWISVALARNSHLLWEWQGCIWNLLIEKKKVQNTVWEINITYIYDHFPKAE